jgi:hypothetical protein
MPIREAQAITQRVRRDGVRRRREAATPGGGLPAAGVIVITAFAAALWLTGSSVPAPRAVAGPPVGSANETPAASQNTHGGVVGDAEALLGGPSLARGSEVRRLLTELATKPRFDGSIRGWRIGPYSALAAEGVYDSETRSSCDARQAGAETVTDLDFSIGYLPRDLEVVAVNGPMKWLCGGEGFSVSYSLSVEGTFGGGEIQIVRFVETERVIELDVPTDSVEETTVNGHPAIVVHPADDATGLGLGVVIVIEDDSGPELRVLRAYSHDAVPFAELMMIVEGIK